MGQLQLCVARQPVHDDPRVCDALAANQLSYEELRLLSPRASPKRIGEFIAGRIAARKAVSKLLGISRTSRQFRILHEGDGPTGRPVVDSSKYQVKPQVSITHAEGIALAVAAFGKVGIDIAKNENHAQSFVQEAFSAEEVTQWTRWLGRGTPPSLVLTTAFAAKEAALKWLGTGFGLPLRAVEIVPASNGENECPPTFEVPTLFFDLALSVRDTAQSFAVGGRLARLGDNIAVIVLELAG